MSIACHSSDAILILVSEIYIRAYVAILMRLTMVAPVDLREGRGVETVIFSLLRYKPNDIEVKIVTSDSLLYERKSQAEVDRLTHNATVIKFHSHYPPVKRFFSLPFELFRAFVKKSFIKDFYDIRKNEQLYNEIRRTDVVFLLDNHYALLFEGLSIPIIGSEHISTSVLSSTSNNRIRNFLLKKNYELYYRNINGFIAFPRTARTRKNELDLFKYSLLLPNGVDCSTFFPVKERETGNKLRLLFVGALYPTKGLDIILPMLEKLSDCTDIEMHIVGWGPLEEQVKRNNRIVYHGKLSNDQLSQLERDCDLFVYPTRLDIFPNVVLEALASGLHVLTCDFLMGVFDDFEKLGYLEYFPADPGLFAKRIKQILKNRQLINVDKMNLHTYISENYDWRVISEKFYNFIHKCFEDSRIGTEV